MALALIMTTIVPYSYLSGIFAVTAKAETVKYVLNADDIDSQYVTNTELGEAVSCGTSDYFTLSKLLKVDTSKKTFDVEAGKFDITNRIKTNSQTSSKDRAISFTVSDGMTAKIEVCAVSGKSEADTTIALYDSNGIVADTLTSIASGTTPTTIWQNIPAGSYYIAVGSDAATSANFYYVAVTEEKAAQSYNMDCTITLNDANVSTYDLSGTYESSVIKADAGELAAALENHASLTIKAGSSDTLASGLDGTYTATVYSADKLIVVKVGETIVAKVSYSVAGDTSVMPKVFSYGSPSSLEVNADGQKLVLTQTGGELKTTDGAIDSSVSYFGFDATADVVELTADVTIDKDASGTGNSSGVFFGAFDGTYIATLGVRGLTGLRGIFSKSSTELAGAGGINTTVKEEQTVTFTAKKTDKGLIITATPSGGETQTQTISYSSSSYLLLKEKGESQVISYGFILSNVTATIQNMKYYDASGNLVYDQNAIYEAEGTIPVVSSVTAEAASTRQYITVDWTASTPATGDGMYVLQVSTDNGASWTDVATDLTETTYKYEISGAGSYLFRVCGKLGVNGTADTAHAVESNVVSVVAALASPVVSTSSTASSIDLSWEAVETAVKYEVYRYSYDDTAENVKLIATVTEASYKDEAVTAEMPYYYYVIAYSDDNYSNPSETVWTVPTAGHTGTYVYEDDAAGITITKKSYDTVYNGKITLEGVVEKAGTVALLVNGKTVDTQQVEVRGTFAFDDIAIEQGRNDVNIEVTDTDGNVTRQTFNFVYLTNYDIVVDAAFTGTDGDLTDNIPTYKTVQAAVNSVASSNAERVVILVKAGDYEEHLTVNSPNITLIGEDSTKTRIFYNSLNVEKEGSANGQVGGDTAQRCAVYVMSGATGFSAENLTFENTYEYRGDGTISNESCDALRNDANNASYVNVRLLGYQDTLNANGGTQYYYKCYIAGNVDFIYGNDPRAFFNDCQIVFRYNSNKNSGYVCAPKTNANAAYGLTFYNCQVLSENGCSGSKYYLARPWGADAYITWIDCYIGKIIKVNAANPYADMSGNAASAARFFEYGSYGPGYAINANRRQISKTMADKMITSEYLTWDPYTAVSNIGNEYVGTITGDTTDKFIETDYVTDSYATTDGDDTGLSKYSIEGYAQAANVTGGGTLMETSDNYYTVATAEEFLTALINIKKSGMASVIELTKDIALGSNEIENFDSYSSIIKAHTYQALTHPTLIETGVSMLKLDGMSNLTIYSKNGAKITHVCTDITGSSNIIIRNLTFDELWEWDDETEGGYDRNDWDYMTIEKGSHDIWVDHCTFYKAYDGVIDIKTPTVSSNITISWCSFQPASAGQTSPTDGGAFFEAIMQAMEKAYEEGSNKYTYYNHLRDEGMTAEQIRGYAYGQKKTHLLGQSDTDTTALNITATFANNWYNNSMDRMPRLRFGTAHVYNCIMDAQTLREIKLGITASLGEKLASKIVSNGTSSNMGAHELLENCYISGIKNALISGNGDSARGYINAINSVYYIDGEETELTVINNTSDKTLEPLVQNAAEFIEALPYSGYNLYSADSLNTVVKPYTGAGVLNLTTLQWEKTVYNDQHTHTWDEGAVKQEATCVSEGTFVYTCTSCGAQKTEIIAATGKHNYSDDWTVDKDATTEEAGEKSHHCIVCGDKTDITAIPKLEVSETPDETPDTTPDVTPDTTPSETPDVTPDTTPSETPDVTPDTTPSETPDVTPDTTPSETPDVTPDTTPSVTPDDSTVTDKPEVTEPSQEKAEVSESEASSAEITVSKTDEVPQIAFTESKSELLNKLLTAEEKIEVKAGADVKVSMKVETVNAEDKTAESTAIKAAVAAMTEQNTIGMYLDITLEKNVGNSAPVQVKETVGGKLSISVEVPAEMINTDSTKERKYSVVRYHENEDGTVLVDILDADFADGKITFESDKFSVYAVIYSDSDITTSDNNVTETEETPAQEDQTGGDGNEITTGDSLSPAYVMGLFAMLLISALTLFVLLRKEEI
jgi:pectin methylesterase-like acyl-CoA thioesterase/pectate lyase